MAEINESESKAVLPVDAEAETAAGAAVTQRLQRGNHALRLPHARRARHVRKQEVISYLANCSYQEFMSTMREVLPARPETGLHPESLRPHRWPFGKMEFRLVLCLFARRTTNKDPLHARRLTWTPWRLYTTLAYPDRAYSDDGNVAGGWPLEQYGHCPECKMELNAATKGGICPLCGSEVGLS